MAKTGRGLLIEAGGTAVAGLQNVSVTIDKGLVDITDIGDAGNRTLADFSGTQTIDVSADGVWTDSVLRTAAFGANPVLTGYAIKLGDTTTAELTGNWAIQSYEETGSHDGAVTFRIQLQSSGAITLTA